MVTVRAFSSGVEAALAKSLLDDHGIVSRIADENSFLYTGAGFALPVRLLVAEEQLEEAARILSDPPDGLNLEPAKEEKIAKAASRFRAEEKQNDNNPWQLLALAALIAIPGIALLVQKYGLVLVAYRRPTVRGTTIIPPAYAHLLGFVVVAIACLLVFLYFYVRRDVGTQERKN